MHPLRPEIERELVSRRSSFRDLGRDYALSKSAISRHVSEGHIAERLALARDEADLREALDLVRQLKAINNGAGAIFQEAMVADEDGHRKNPSLALRAMDRVLRQLELHARLAGQLVDRHDVNVRGQEGSEILEAVIRALAPFPEAREAVLEAVREASFGER